MPAYPRPPGRNLTQPGTHDFVIGGIRYKVTVGRDEHGYFWGQAVDEEGATITSATIHDQANEAWGDILEVLGML